MSEYHDKLGPLKPEAFDNDFENGAGKKDPSAGTKSFLEKLKARLKTKMALRHEQR